MLAPSNPVADVCAVNSTALSPGKTCGHRCVNSPGASVVNGSGVPPPEGTRERGLDGESAAMMLSSSPQAPPRPVGASHTVRALPPSTETFFSLPSAKNATHWPSGLKNGANAPCDPGSSVAAGLIQSTAEQATA